MDLLPRDIEMSYTTPLVEGHLGTAFDVALARLDLRHLRRASVRSKPYDADDLAQWSTPLELVASTDTPHGQRVWFARAGEDALVVLTQGHGFTHVRAAAPTPAAAEVLLESVTAAVLVEESAADPRVPIWFWTDAEHGPHPTRRKLHAPMWAEIADNYAPPVRHALERMMASDPAAATGIALWRGAPGTGKTTALRALARAWHDRADIHVILDPEIFLGDRAAYLVNVLFGDGADEHWADDESMGVVINGGGQAVAMPFGTEWMPQPTPQAHGRRAKLIVLEDAGELISADARISSGQALSRLLNLTDGMLGQGSNVSVLVTTNEPVDRLHPAIARPGRGWAHVAFREFGAHDAATWLERHGVTGDEAVVDAEAVTLAELYARVRGDQIVSLDALAD
ncbi:MAG: ATPase [Thermoleophilia bacterium]|nr:ATPase [Thermoleophilia bacterium]